MYRQAAFSSYTALPNHVDSVEYQQDDAVTTEEGHEKTVQKNSVLEEAGDHSRRRHLPHLAYAKVSSD